MNKEEILEYNKRCAEFLGYKCSINEQYELPNMMIFPPKEKSNLCHTAKVCCVNDMQFHSNWNWIMEVVETIEQKSKYIIMGRDVYSSFDIGRQHVKFYFSPNNQYLLQLELKQFLPDEPWIHTMYKHHIVQQFDFKTHGKQGAVVQAINQFLIWYNETKL